MTHPFIAGTALDPRLDGHLLARIDDIRRIARELAEGHYYLILAAAGSGRTTILKAVERELRERSAVLLLRPSDLALSSAHEFFVSLCDASDAALIQAAGFVDDRGRLSVAEEDRPFDAWLASRTPVMNRRLIYLLDDIDLMPPNLLQELAGVAHAKYNDRNDKPHLRKVGFAFAGAISLRYMTLNDDPKVSPFNVCTEYLVRDLTPVVAVDHLRRVVAHYSLPFDDESLEQIVWWAGGDLNLLHRLAGLTLARGGERITATDIEKSVRELVPDSGKISDETLRRTLLLVEEDRATLQLVLELLENDPQGYEPRHTEEVLLEAFGITYPELSGAVALHRNGRDPSVWRFRHRLARRLASKYFTPRRAVRLHASYGEFEEAERHAGPILKQVCTAFAGGALDFDDSGLSDVLMCLTNHIYASASDETAYHVMSLLLREGFGCEELAYFEHVPPEQQLKAPKFLAHLFPANDGQTFSLTTPAHHNMSEVRAFRSRLFFTSGRSGDRVRVSFPLKNLAGRVTAVISAMLPNRGEGSITVAFKVQMMQKALNPINIALNKVEVTLKERIIDSAQLVRGGPVNGGMPVFVAHKFSEELLGNMRDHLGRASKAMDFQYVDERQASGLLLAAIRQTLEQSGLAIYEVTKVNNNVYFEIGLGLGLNRPGLLFSRRPADGDVKLPPLLAPLLRLDYSDYTGLLERLNHTLEQILSEYLLQRNTATRLHFLRVEEPYCARRKPFVLVLDHDHFRDQRDYRRHLEAGLGGRMPILYGTKPYGGFEQCVETRSNLVSELEALWCAVKCANYVIFRCEHFESDAQAAQAFIGAGLAHGLGHPNVKMTFLTRDINGATLRQPADLDGFAALEYLKLSELEVGIREMTESWGAPPSIASPSPAPQSG